MNTTNSIGTFLFFMLLLCFGAVHAQEVVLEQDVNKDTIDKPYGPNKRHFLHGYVSYGLLFGSPDEKGGKVKAPQSYYFDGGLRYKLKVGGFYSIGLGLGLNSNSYRLVQEKAKRVPDNIIHDKEWIRRGGATGEFFNRFNFGKRGNHVGNFFDLGAYLDYAWSRKHVYEDEVESSIAKKRKVELRGLDYMEALQYGFLFRAGYNRYVLFARYRFSDLFKESEPGQLMPELPRFKAGVQIGMHQ